MNETSFKANLKKDLLFSMNDKLDKPKLKSKIKKTRYLSSLNGFEPYMEGLGGSTLDNTSNGKKTSELIYGIE